MAGQFTYSDHAFERIGERHVTRSEVEYAILNAKDKKPGPKGRTIVTCDLAFGRRLKVAYKLMKSGNYLIVTVFWVKGQP